MRLAAVLLTLLLAACTDAQGAGAAPSAAATTAASSAQPGATTASTPSSAPTAAATAEPTAALTAAPSSAKAQPHVFVIVMENTGYARALRSAPIATLASRYALASNYHAISRPSLPNYLAMTSGSTWGVADDGYHALPATGLGAQLTS